MVLQGPAMCRQRQSDKSWELNCKTQFTCTPQLTPVVSGPPLWALKRDLLGTGHENLRGLPCTQGRFPTATGQEP